VTPADAADLSSLLKQLKSAYKDAEISSPSDDPYADPVEHVLWALLLWECTPVKAREAYKRFIEATTDFNELRVMLKADFEELLGPRYPLVSERAARIKMALNDIYNREHDVTLAHLHKAQKREARKYLDSIEGLPHFAAARVVAVSLGGHAIPHRDGRRRRQIRRDLPLGLARAGDQSRRRLRGDRPLRGLDVGPQPEREGQEESAREEERRPGEEDDEKSRLSQENFQEDDA